MNISKLRSLITALFALTLLSLAISPAGAASKNIILATTTSTQDSGLLDVLIPIFEKESGYFVKTIAVGSGQAMKMGEKGEADVLLVHSPDAEKKFLLAGFGSNRMLVMHNDFIVVGPAGDPAKIKGQKSSAEAFKKIAQAESLFHRHTPDESQNHSSHEAVSRSDAAPRLHPGGTGPVDAFGADEQGAVGTQGERHRLQ